MKGYEIGQDEYVVLEPDEIAAAVPESDKTLAVGPSSAATPSTTSISTPYYLAPERPECRGGLRADPRRHARQERSQRWRTTVLFRRVRTVLIRPHGDGLIATTLNFDYEVRSAEEAFHDIPAMKIKGEMLDLAKHIIATKRGTFDPGTFDDRYEEALAELVKAKLEGTPLADPQGARSRPRSST